MTALTYTPRPGDIFLTQIGGLLGLLIRIAQGIGAGDWSRYTHVGVILDDDEVLAAQPHGARVDPIESILFDRPLAILPLPGWVDDEQRALIVRIARDYEGHRYGFLSYLWIGLTRLPVVRWRLRTAQTAGRRPRGVLGWLMRLVESESTGLICSALADRVWWHGGVHLFRGHLFGEVSPGDIAHTGTVHHIGTGPYRVVPLPDDVDLDGPEFYDPATTSLPPRA